MRLVEVTQDMREAKRALLLIQQEMEDRGHPLLRHGDKGAGMIEAFFNHDISVRIYISGTMTVGHPTYTIRATNFDVSHLMHEFDRLYHKP